MSDYQGNFWICDTETKLTVVMEEIEKAWKEHHWIKVKFSTGKQRSHRQQAAIEVYCRLIAEKFNDSGLTFNEFFTTGFEVPWTQKIVKDNIWRKIQEAVLSKHSTTELERPEVSLIYDNVNRKLSEHGYHVPFPDKSQLNEI